ncbi:hypothetical protein WR25_04826 [Diploscapter pachys]|uniref:C2H2-type domain-containing protein n=1 Tax=Diploscapter pachys TaxID=2018661 RepID=A0A2A2J7C3_9BILA|nr:hypothetical protein WR25_04826 [Diploscapter pachys]
MASEDVTTTTTSTGTSSDDAIDVEHDANEREGEEKEETQRDEEANAKDAENDATSPLERTLRPPSNTSSNDTNFASKVKKRVRCETCEKTFCDKGALKIHTSAVHLKEMHMCTIPGCGKEFSSRRSRNRHSANTNPKLHVPENYRDQITSALSGTASATIPSPLLNSSSSTETLSSGSSELRNDVDSVQKTTPNIIPSPAAALALALLSRKRKSADNNERRPLDLSWKPPTKLQFPLINADLQLMLLQQIVQQTQASALNALQNSSSH